METRTDRETVKSSNPSPLKILLCGFNPFANLTVNSSEAIVREIEKRWKPHSAAILITDILPTEYQAAEDRIRDLIRQLKPDVVLCLGVAESRSEISLERIALNWDDENAPDNAGDVRLAQQITEGPPAYWSTLPLKEIQSALQKHGVPVSFSNHAGTYACNQLLYSATDEVQRRQLDARCGLIHVPAIANQKGWTRRGAGLPLEMMVAAIESCLRVIVNPA